MAIVIRVESSISFLGLAAHEFRDVLSVALDERWQRLGDDLIDAAECPVVHLVLPILQDLLVVVFQVLLDSFDPLHFLEGSFGNFGLAITRVGGRLLQVVNPWHSVDPKLFPEFALISFADD